MTVILRQYRITDWIPWTDLFCPAYWYPSLSPPLKKLEHSGAVVQPRTNLNPDSVFVISIDVYRSNLSPGNKCDLLSGCVCGYNKSTLVLENHCPACLLYPLIILVTRQLF